MKKSNLNQKLKAELEIISVMRKSIHNSDVVKEALSFLKLEEKTEEEILFLMKKVKYNWRFCNETIHLLKSEVNILNVMKKSGYFDTVFSKGLRLLKLSEDEKKVESLIIQSNWESRTCAKGIKIFLKNRKDDNSFFDGLKRRLFPERDPEGNKIWRDSQGRITRIDIYHDFFGAVTGYHTIRYSHDN